MYSIPYVVGVLPRQQPGPRPAFYHTDPPVVVDRAQEDATVRTIRISFIGYRPLFDCAPVIGVIRWENSSNLPKLATIYKIHDNLPS